MKLALFVFLFAATVFAGSKMYPVKRYTMGRSQFIHHLEDEKIDSYDKLYETYDSGIMDSGDQKKATYRYLYSPRWGWVDMKHLSSGIHFTAKWYLSGHDVLALGKAEEAAQYAAGQDSAYSYEDLTSNLLGVYFYSRYWDEEAEGKNFLEAFALYLEALGFSNTPVMDAPNEIPMDYTLKDIPHNYRYKPRFTKAKEKEYTDLDRKIMRYSIFF